MDLVILVGGKGTRIAKILKNLPKPMVKFYNKHFLSIILQEYLKFPFENVYLLCGYRGNIIFEKYHNKYLNLAKIKVYLFKKKLKSFFIFLQKKQDHLSSIKDLDNINIDWKNSLYIGNQKIKLKCDKYKIDDIIDHINFKKK